MPKIKGPQFKQLVNERVGVNVSNNQCKRVKKKVMSTLMGRYKEKYAQVWDYAGECELQNLSNRVYVDVMKMSLPGCGIKFDRIYVYFMCVSRNFWLVVKELQVWIDVLNGLCKKELLFAVGRDDNN